MQFDKTSRAPAQGLESIGAVPEPLSAGVIADSCNKRANSLSTVGYYTCPYSIVYSADNHKPRLIVCASRNLDEIRIVPQNLGIAKVNPVFCLVCRTLLVVELKLHLV
jgi:hypothetical protein